VCVAVHELSRADACRIAVRAQLLDSSRPADLLDVVRRLTLLQLDPVAAVAPSADLVAWSRLGSAYAPAQLGQPFSGRAALLSPFDRLIHDRKRTADLFGFDYQLEMYKPVASRRWGYYALPVLYGDALVGKLDATADRQAGVLRVRAIHQDVPFTEAMTEAIGREIEDLARWLNLDLTPSSPRR
jgi:uncharacterized protein YcaQ